MKTNLSPVSVTRPGLQYLLDFVEKAGRGRPFAVSGELQDISLDSELARSLALAELETSLPWKDSAKSRPTPRAFSRIRGPVDPTPAAAVIPKAVSVSLRCRGENGLSLSISGVGPDQALVHVNRRLASKSLRARLELLANEREVVVNVEDVRFTSPGAKPLAELRESYRSTGLICGSTVRTAEGRQWTWLPALLHVLSREVVAALEKRHVNSSFSPALAAVKTAHELAALDGVDFRSELCSTADWPDPATLTLAHAFEFGLAILEAWYRQRVAWATNLVEIEPGVTVSTPGQRWLALNPDDLWIRVRGDERKPKNWRGWLWNNLFSLAGLEPCELQPNGTVRRQGGLLAAVFDGRGIRGSNLGLSSALQVALRDAGHETLPHFFVRVSDRWAETFIPHVVDVDGGLRWGRDSVEALKEKLQATEGRASRDEINDYRHSLRTNNYFRIDPAWLLLAEAVGLSKAQRRLLLTIWSEALPRAKPRSRANTRTQESTERIFGGSQGAGYMVETWLWKAGYARRGQPTPAALRSFLKDFRSLAGTFGFELATRDGDVCSIDEYTRIASQPRYWRRDVVHVRLPADRSDMSREQLASLGVFDTSPARPNSPDGTSLGEELLKARKKAGMTQADVAAHLGVSAVMVSHWERGAKRLAVAHRAALSLLFDIAALAPDEVKSGAELPQAAAA